MAGLWITLLSLAALTVWVLLSVRLRGLRRELDETRAQLARLTRRVFELETLNAPPQPPLAPAPPPPIAAPLPQLNAPPRRPLAERVSAEEWEAIVGGSWLNRVGVLVLVIGIALFLGYSLTRLGAAGKVGVGLAVSLSMLGAGVALEQRPQYANFARGLIGGGWAALYFTVFAMYGVPAARVIGSPGLGMALLLAVAGGMILHSFRYRSQVVTGLAYFAAFAALKIGPPTLFAVAASIPLAASLLFVAQRFNWIPLAAAGLVLTYGVFALGYRAAFELENRLLGEPILWTYWLLFEAFDIVEQRRRGDAYGLARTIFPLNAVGLVGASLLTWVPVTSPELARFLALAAVAFLASALLRAKVLAPRPAGVDEPWFGVWEPPVTVSSLLGLFAIVHRFSGIGITIGLLMEAEFIVLAGVLLGNQYLRWLGAALFIVPASRICVVDYQSSARTVQLGVSLRTATPVALLSAALASINRRLHATPLHSVLATVLLSVAAVVEVPEQCAGLALLAIAAGLAALTARTRTREFAIEAWAMIAISTAVFIVEDVFGPHTTAVKLSLAIAAAVLYAGAGLLRPLSPGAAEAAFSIASLYAASLAWHVLPEGSVALAWAALGLFWFSIGLRWSVALRVCAYLIAVAAFFRVLIVNFELPDAPSRIVAAVIAAVAFYAEQFLAPPQLDRVARPFFSILGTGMITLLLAHEVSGRMLTVAFGLQGVTLLIAGFALRERVLRVSGLALFFFCVLKLFVYDLRQLDTFSRIISFIALGLLLVGASWVYTRFREQIRKLL